MATQESFLNLSYDTKNTRINQLIDQIFKDVSEDDIKVGLIDPILGYVVEVSICEANDYAKDNPGTAFIFRDANNSIQYLNINEVNALTPEVLVSSASTCSGIQTRKKCGEGPPRIQFFGGGGVGAQANAIVGIDGAILAVDVITGGFGYQYPPLVKAIDDCQYGSGATLSSELGELSETFVTFEDENDFEDYEICPDTTVGYGRNWGPNGEDLGAWEPETYTNVGKDPIREEIDAYQKSLLKTSNPFWTTKSTPPKSITAEGKKYNVPYVVTDFRWSDFMNLYAISPVPPSNVNGTDEAGKLFVFDWDVDFPYDGEYTFRGLCDNVSKLYVDNIQLFDLGSFNDAVRPTKKELKAGPHNIRIDLLNLPILEVERKQNKKPDVIRRPGFDTTTTTIEPGIYLDLTQYRADENVNCSFDIPLRSDLSLNIPEVGVVSGGGGFEGGPSGSGRAVVVGPSSGVKPIGGDYGGELFLKGGRLYGPITIVPNPAFLQSDLFIGMAVGAVNDRNVELNFNTAFPLAGGNVSWVPYITYLQGVTGRDAQQEGSGFSGVYFQESLNAFAIVKGSRPEDADNNNYTPIEIDVVLGFTIRTPGGFFRRITQPITTSSTVRTSTYVETEEPVFEVVGNATVDVPRASAPSTIRNENVFNTVDYISKANRTLWRTNPAASLTSGLLDRYGVCPFDTSSAEAQVESFAGIHTIIWNNINFPVTGDYRIQIAVDDNVSLYIGETLIRKEGFYAPGKRNPDLDQVYTFNQGNYTIRAELENIEVGPIAIRNPMVLAVNIETTFTTGEIVSPKSFNENPMGISVSIDAPPLPVPKEPAPIQTGRCPPNPIWSTRFPTSKEPWYPVRRTTGDPTKGTAWSKFMNRYAISPVPPFDTDETDSAGVNFINTWTVELPYPGFYGVRGTVDNSGRVLIDGKEVSKLDSFGTTNPRLEKVYLEKGTHQIEVEVFNTPTERAFDIPIKVFSTDDWIYETNLTQQTGSVDINFKITTDAGFGASMEILGLYTISKPPGDPQINETLIRSVEIGKVYDVKFNSSGGIVKLRSIGISGIGMEDLTDNDYNDMICIADNGKFFDFVGNTCKFAVAGTTTITGGLTAGTSKNGVTYEGPALTSYVPGLISPVFQNTLTPTEEIQGKTFIMTWRNIDFPEDGKYNLTALADDLVIVRVDGVEVGRAKVFEDRRTFLFNATKGKKSVQLELSNIRIPNTGFRENPVVTFVEIIKNSSVSKVAPLPWTTNPIGVSAILIPPPCPKLVKGKGIISRVIVLDTGNGYSCPPGLVLNPETGKCEPPPKECPPGQILDPKTGQCINICPPGEVYDKVTKKCIKPPIDCPPGQVYDPVTQKCVDLPPNPCPPGEVRNPITGLCEPAPPCPPGEVRNPITGKCEPIPGEPPRPPGEPPRPPGEPPRPPGEPPGEPPRPPGYPVCLILDEVLVENPGINYNCGVDQLQIVPDNGVILDYVCDSFGRISRVKILDNGTCFPEYPSITMVSDTGVNASFRPVFRVVRDPIDPALTRDNQKLIQVTDLVGLKQTGYIDGRPYYGAVFYENGIRYAGYYKTVGTLIRVYDTLQESITAEVTTAPSAIEKFGTDNNSNNPRLNIPGTPTNLI